jgi:hypothetical protein
MIEYSIQQYEKDYREGCDLEDARTLPPTEALLLVGKLINASNAPQKPPGMTHAIVLGQQLLKQGTLRLRDAAFLHYASPRYWPAIRVCGELLTCVENSVIHQTQVPQLSPKRTSQIG